MEGKKEQGAESGEMDMSWNVLAGRRLEERPERMTQRPVNTRGLGNDDLARENTDVFLKRGIRRSRMKGPNDERRVKLLSLKSPKGKT